MHATQERKTAIQCSSRFAYIHLKKSCFPYCNCYVQVGIKRHVTGSPTGVSDEVAGEGTQVHQEVASNLPCRV